MNAMPKLLGLSLMCQIFKGSREQGACTQGTLQPSAPKQPHGAAWADFDQRCMPYLKSAWMCNDKGCFLADSLFLIALLKWHFTSSGIHYNILFIPDPRAQSQAHLGATHMVRRWAEVLVPPPQLHWRSGLAVAQGLVFFRTLSSRWAQWRQSGSLSRRLALASPSLYWAPLFVSVPVSK